MTRIRIGLAVLVTLSSLAHGENPVDPAKEQAAAEAAAKRDAEALGWILKRTLREVGQARVVIEQQIAPIPDQVAGNMQLAQQIDQQAGQVERMLDPILGSELEMVRLACGNLDKAARQSILKAGKAELKKAARGLAERQLTGRFGQDDFDPRVSIRDGLRTALKAASPEKVAAYQAEQDQRAARQAKAARLRIVAKLDGQLDLSAAQRRQIEADLEAKWDASWVRALWDVGMINDQPIAPDFAGPAIEPHLAASQKTAWATWCREAGSNLIGRRFMNWHFDGQGLQGIDDWWER